MAAPLALDACGHTLCAECVLKVRGSCPLCRTRSAAASVNFALLEAYSRWLPPSANQLAAATHVRRRTGSSHPTGLLGVVVFLGMGVLMVCTELEDGTLRGVSEQNVALAQGAMVSQSCAIVCPSDCRF
jgi:hypothetical protein